MVERSHKNPGTSHSRRNKSGDARTGVNGSGDADLDEDSDAASDGANGDGGRSGPRRGNATDSSSDSDEDASPIKKRGRPKKAATAKKKKAAQDTTAEDAFLAESSSDDGVGDVLGGLADHHVFGHIETKFLGKSLELLNLVVSDGALLSNFVRFNFDGSDGTEEK